MRAPTDTFIHSFSPCEVRKKGSDGNRKGMGAGSVGEEPQERGFSSGGQFEGLENRRLHLRLTKAFRT